MKTFEIITKKNKRKHLFKTVVLAVLGSSAALLALDFGLSRLTARNGQHVRDYYQLMAEISQPNIGYRKAYFNPTSQYTGTFHVDQTKDIAGIEIPYESVDLHYSLRRLFRPIISYGYSDKKGTATYTYGGGYKIPHFFNTRYRYTADTYYHLTQDIGLLSQMSGQAVEVAVTFDKPYTYQEIAELVPDNLKINWYWIGTRSNYNTAETPQAVLGFDGGMTLQTYEQAQAEQATLAQLSIEEREAYWARQKPQPEITPEQGFYNSYTHFIAHLDEALDREWLSLAYGGPNGVQMSLNDDVTAYLKANPDGKTAKFAGVILTGRAEDFASLEKAKWIFGSNIGQHVTIQPYHTLDVE